MATATLCGRCAPSQSTLHRALNTKTEWMVLGLPLACCGKLEALAQPQELTPTAGFCAAQSPPHAVVPSPSLVHGETNTPAEQSPEEDARRCTVHGDTVVDAAGVHDGSCAATVAVEEEEAAELKPEEKRRLELKKELQPPLLPPKLKTEVMPPLLPPGLKPPLFPPELKPQGKAAAKEQPTPSLEEQIRQMLRELGGAEDTDESDVG